MLEDEPLLVVKEISSESEKDFFGEFSKEKIMQDGPLLVMNGVVTCINGLQYMFFWFTPITGVIGPYL